MMRRSLSTGQSAATASVAQARPKSQPPIKLGESAKFVGAAKSTQQTEEEQHWSKLIEKYDKSRGRFAAGGPRPMLETLVEHSSSDAANERVRPDDDSDEDEPELSPLTSSASSSSGSSLASSTLSLSSVSSASTVIGANKMPTKRNASKVKLEPAKVGVAVVVNISDEEDHQSSESSSCSSGVSSLSDRKASLCSTSSSGSGSGETLGQLEESVDKCLGDLVSSVVHRAQVDAEAVFETEESGECTLRALMVKRIPLDSRHGENFQCEPNQIIGLARRHIFNALKLAQEIGERESSWWVRVSATPAGDKPTAAADYHQTCPAIGWHQDTDDSRRQQVFQVPASEIIDCLIEHELVIWLLESNQRATGSNYLGGKNKLRKDNGRTLNELEHATSSGNLIGVHSEVDCDTDQLERQQQQQQHGSQLEAVVWLCSSDSDARQVKEGWLRLSGAAGASDARPPPPPPIVCQTVVRVDRESEQISEQLGSGNEIKLSRGESASGIVIAAAVADQPRAHRRDNNEQQQQQQQPAERRSTSTGAGNLRKAASVFDLSTSGRQCADTCAEETRMALTTTGLAGYYRNARSSTNKLIRNMKDEMVTLKSGACGRRVSSVLVVQQSGLAAAAASAAAPDPSRQSPLRATSSVCDLSDSRKLLQVGGDGKLICSATIGIIGESASASQTNSATLAAPLRASQPATAPIVKPRTSILKARRDAANTEALSKSAVRQQVAGATGGDGKCGPPLHKLQQQQNINRGSRMVSSTSLNCLHQLSGEKPAPRSILKASQAEVEPSNQLNGSSKCSSGSGDGGGAKCNVAHVVVVSAAAASLAAAGSPLKIKPQQQQPSSADSNESTRAASSGGIDAAEGKRWQEKSVELCETKGGADGGKQDASPQTCSRSRTLAHSSSAASRRKLVHSLANCEIVARTHQQTQPQPRANHQRARELSLSTSDIREQRQRGVNSSGASKEIGAKSCAAKRDGSGTSKQREEPANTKGGSGGGRGGGEDEFVSSGSLAREQAFERLRMRASCYDITRLMSKDNTIQSQLARLRAGGGGGDLRQRKPAELRASGEQLTGKTGQELVPERDALVLVGEQMKKVTPEDPKRSKRVSMFEQSGAPSGAAAVSRDTGKSAAVKRAESVRCKKPAGGVAVLRHQELADEVCERAGRANTRESADISESLEAQKPREEREKRKVVDKIEVKSDNREDESDLEGEEDEQVKTEEGEDEGDDSEATIVEEPEDREEDEPEVARTKTSTIGKATTGGGLSKFNLLRQSFNQKTISSMLKFSSRASLRIGAGKRAPVPGLEVPNAATSGESSRDEMKLTKENVRVVVEPKQVAMPTKLPKASKNSFSSSKQLVDLQQQQIAAIDSATMVLYNRHMQQHQQRQQLIQQQQQQQQQQQYAYQWHQQQQIYIQQQQHHHHQRQQLAYMANQYMTTAAHHHPAAHHHLYQPHSLMPGAPIAPQATMGGFGAASSATTSMYAMSGPQHAQQALMMPPAHHHQQPASGVGSLLKKSILKSSSSKHNVAQMTYSAGGRAPTGHAHHPSQQFIPLSVNHHSSVNIVYGAPGLAENAAAGPQQFAAQQREEPPASKIKQPSRANLLGASMRKTVKSILVKSSSSSSSRQHELEKQMAQAKPLKSALKTSKNRVVPDSIQLNSEGSDGDQSTSSTLESTSSSSSFDRDRDCDRDQQRTSHHQQPKSVLKKKSSLTSGTSPSVLDDSLGLSSADESSSSSDKNFKRATSTRCSRRITKSPPKQFEPGAATVASRASIRAPRKNVTFSTKLTSIL